MHSACTHATYFTWHAVVETTHTPCGCDSPRQYVASSRLLLVGSTGMSAWRRLKTAEPSPMHAAATALHHAAEQQTEPAQQPTRHFLSTNSRRCHTHGTIQLPYTHMRFTTPHSCTLIQTTAPTQQYWHCIPGVSLQHTCTLLALPGIVAAHPHHLDYYTPTCALKSCQRSHGLLLCTGCWHHASTTGSTTRASRG